MPREVRLPQPQRRPVDISFLTNLFAGPEVARQRAKAGLFEEIGAIPGKAVGVYEAIQELKRKKLASELEGKIGQAQLSIFEAEQKPLPDTHPLVLKFPELKGLPINQIKGILSSLVRPQPQPTYFMPPGGGEPQKFGGKVVVGRQTAGVTFLDPETGEAQFTGPAGTKLLPRTKSLSSVEVTTVKEVGKTEEMLRSLRKAHSDLPDSFFSRPGPFNPLAYSHWLTRAAGTPAFANFKREAVKLSNQYRKMITGAQASFPELQYLEFSTPSPKDPDVQFMDAFNRNLEEIAKAKEIIISSLQAQGKPVPNILRGGPVGGVVREPGGDQKKTAKERFEELEKSGIPKQRAYQILKQEGY